MLRLKNKDQRKTRQISGGLGLREDTGSARLADGHGKFYITLIIEMFFKLNF